MLPKRWYAAIERAVLAGVEGQLELRVGGSGASLVAVVTLGGVVDCAHIVTLVLPSDGAAMTGCSSRRPLRDARRRPTWSLTWERVVRASEASATGEDPADTPHDDVGDEAQQET